MSESSRIAIVMSRVTEEVAARLFAESLEILIEQYEFGFRGTGGLLRLVFDEQRYKWEEPIGEKSPSAGDITAGAISELIQRYKWFSAAGTIRMEGRKQLRNCQILHYPTFDRNEPSCLIFVLEASLYHDVYGEDDDEFHEDAADTLLALTVRLGANELVDGFQMLLIGSFAEIQPFDGRQLRQSLLEPTSIADRREGKGFPHGWITGIKRSLLPLPQIRQVWQDGQTFETVSGFSILNDLIAIEDDDDEDEDDLEDEEEE